MLRSTKTIMGYQIRAVVEDIGKVRDLYFDDREWKVRYVVVDTGGWLSGRKVLISPESLDEPDWNNQVVPARLTKQQIEHGPAASSDKPVSRQHEVELAGYFGWTPYWGPLGAPGAIPPVVSKKPEEQKMAEENDPHLRSQDEVLGYHILASDGQIGHADDFIVDTKEWTIRYIVVDTRNWLPGKHVLIAPAWVQSVDWSERLLRVDMTRQDVQDAPEFDPSAPVNPEYEARLYDFYGRPVYWDRTESLSSR
jgi:uncharacterized protein YrrD